MIIVDTVKLITETEQVPGEWRANTSCLFNKIFCLIYKLHNEKLFYTDIKKKKADICLA